MVYTSTTSFIFSVNSCSIRSGVRSSDILYCRSRSDSQGQEFVILNGNVQSDIQDDKKSFVFSLSCTGVHDMHFSVDDEETYHSWVSKLQAACASGTVIVYVAFPQVNFFFSCRVFSCFTSFNGWIHS